MRNLGDEGGEGQMWEGRVDCKIILALVQYITNKTKQSNRYRINNNKNTQLLNTNTKSKKTQKTSKYTQSYFSDVAVI